MRVCAFVLMAVVGEGRSCGGDQGEWGKNGRRLRLAWLPRPGQRRRCEGRAQGTAATSPSCRTRRLWPAARPAAASTPHRHAWAPLPLQACRPASPVNPGAHTPHQPSPLLSSSRQQGRPRPHHTPRHQPARHSLRGTRACRPWARGWTPAWPRPAGPVACGGGAGQPAFQPAWPPARNSWCRGTTLRQCYHPRRASFSVRKASTAALSPGLAGTHANAANVRLERSNAHFNCRADVLMMVCARSERVRSPCTSACGSCYQGADVIPHWRARARQISAGPRCRGQSCNPPALPSHRGLDCRNQSRGRAASIGSEEGGSRKAGLRAALPLCQCMSWGPCSIVPEDSPSPRSPPPPSPLPQRVS